MATISTALRNFKEPSKDELTQFFFSIPASTTLAESAKEDLSVGDVDHMEINAVLSLGEVGVEDSYVRTFELF